MVYISLTRIYKKGDLHEIGKNLAAMMMESAGMTVHNLGVEKIIWVFKRWVVHFLSGSICLTMCGTINEVPIIHPCFRQGLLAGLSIEPLIESSGN